LPIDLPTREGGDSGRPIATQDPATNATAAAFRDLAQNVWTSLTRSA
jgi:hypothetical protein